jgi:hypothetical protein
LFDIDTLHEYQIRGLRRGPDMEPLEQARHRVVNGRLLHPEALGDGTVTAAGPRVRVRGEDLDHPRSREEVAMGIDETASVGGRTTGAASRPVLPHIRGPLVSLGLGLRLDHDRAPPCASDTEFAP